MFIIIDIFHLFRKDTRPDVDKMVQWVGSKMKEELGASIEYCEIGKQDMPDGSKIKLPPVLLAEFGNDPNKNTLLAYGHLDVQPAAKSDGWDYDPWTLTKSSDGKKLYGRGATDDKGTLLNKLFQQFLDWNPRSNNAQFLWCFRASFGLAARY